MRRLFLLAGLLTAGCQSVVGPFQTRPPMRVDDPCYEPSEQERRKRANLPLPDDTPQILPPAGLSRPGDWGSRSH